MADLQVDIVTPRKAVFSGKAGQAVLPGWEGQMGILPGHDALLSLLRAGVLELKGGDGDKKFAVGRGFVEIGSDRVTILADTCERPEDVDKAAAQKEFDEVTGKLVGIDTNSVAYSQLEERLEAARARLAV
jgi:F-type H+-transporting ATPase subunit epsilon